MSKGRTARELALKVLFQIDVGKLPLDEVLETALEEVRPSDEAWDYVQKAVRGVVERQADLDAVIDELAVGWRVERLANVDKNVLRLALYELLHEKGAPASVVVNDAVEVAKKYSTEESGKFVNGILGSFLRRSESGSDEDALEVGAR